MKKSANKLLPRGVFLLILIIYIQCGYAYNYDPISGVVTFTDNDSNCSTIDIQKIKEEKIKFDDTHPGQYIKFFIATDTLDSLFMSHRNDYEFLKQFLDLMRQCTVFFTITTPTINNIDAFMERIKYFITQGILPQFTNLKLDSSSCTQIINWCKRNLKTSSSNSYSAAFTNLSDLVKTRGQIISMLIKSTDKTDDCRFNSVEEIDCEINLQFNRCLGQILLQYFTFPAMPQMLASDAYGYDIANHAFTFFADRTYSYIVFRRLIRVTRRHSLNTLYIPSTNNGDLLVKYDKDMWCNSSSEEQQQIPLQSLLSLLKYYKVILYLDPNVMASRLGREMTTSDPIITQDFMRAVIQLILEQIDIEVKFVNITITQRDIETICQWHKDKNTGLSPDVIRNLEMIAFLMTNAIEARDRASSPKEYKEANSALMGLFSRYIEQLKMRLAGQRSLPQVPLEEIDLVQNPNTIPDPGTTASMHPIVTSTASGDQTLLFPPLSKKDPDPMPAPSATASRDAPPTQPSAATTSTTDGNQTSSSRLVLSTLSSLQPMTAEDQEVVKEVARSIREAGIKVHSNVDQPERGDAQTKSNPESSVGVRKPGRDTVQESSAAQKPEHKKSRKRKNKTTSSSK